MSYSQGAFPRTRYNKKPYVPAVDLFSETESTNEPEPVPIGGPAYQPAQIEILDDESGDADASDETVKDVKQAPKQVAVAKPKNESWKVNFAKKDTKPKPEVKSALKPFNYTMLVTDNLDITAFVGAPKTGKTMICTAKIKLGMSQGLWDRICVLCPTNSNHGAYNFLVGKGYKKFVKENGIKKHVACKIWTKVDEFVLSNICNSCEKNERKARGTPNERTLVVIDDATTDLNIRTSKVCKRLWTTYRHFNFDVFIVYHYIKGVTEELRTAITTWFVTGGGENTINWLYEDFGTQKFINKLDFNRWFRGNVGGYKCVRFDRNPTVNNGMPQVFNLNVR